MTKLAYSLTDAPEGSKLVTVLHDNRGYYTCIMRRNSGARKGLHYLDVPPFWEPFNVSDDRYGTKKEAKMAAIEICDAKSLTFVESA